MTPLHNIIDQLNDKSQSILKKIDEEDMAFDAIRSEMGQREHLVKELGEITRKNPPDSLTDEERISLRILFDNFVELNDSIQKNLENILNRHKDKLNTAVIQRKAEKSYHILKNPNISYF